MKSQQPAPAATGMRTMKDALVSGMSGSQNGYMSIG
jgi:hypothetical protein